MFVVEMIKQTRVFSNNYFSNLLFMFEIGNNSGFSTISCIAELILFKNFFNFNFSFRSNYNFSFHL